MPKPDDWDASRIPDVLIGCSRLIRELIAERNSLRKQIAALREELIANTDKPRRRA